MALRRASAAMNRGVASLLARPSRPPSHTQLGVFDLLVDHGANPAVLCTKGRTAGAGVAHFVVGHSLQETTVLTRLLPKVRGTTADTTVDDVLAEIVADGTLSFNVRPFRENLARLVEKNALLRAPAAAAAAASVAEDQAVSWSSVRAELDKHDAAFLRRVWRRLKPGAGAALAAAREDASQRTPLLPHHAARLLLPPLQEVSRRGGSCVGASISRSTSLSCGGMIGGQQRRALSRSVALLAEEGPITMSGGRGNWQKKVEKAEKTCAEKEEEYAVAHKMEKYAAANPGYATFDQYNELKEATATAKGAYEVAQGELAVARAGKTCAEKEKESAVAQKKLEAYAAANPGDTTSAEYNVLKEKGVTARVAYEAALTRVKVADRGLETEQERADAAVKVVRANQAVLQAEKELGKAEKRRAEKEKEYAIARNKREEYMTANPSDTTSAVYKKLEEWALTAKADYVEMTCAEKEKEYAIARNKREEYMTANPSDTTSAVYKKLEEWALTAKADYVEMTCAEKEKEYAIARNKREEYMTANPSDTTSAVYKKLEEWALTAKADYVEMTCAEKEKESAVAQKKLEAYAAANPGDTTSAEYNVLKEKGVTARVAYEAALTRVKVADRDWAVFRAEQELEKAEKRRAEKEKEYAIARNKREEYMTAHPSDTTSNRYNELEEWALTAKADYVEMTCAEKEKESAVAQKKLEAYAAANPGDTTSAEYNVLKEATAAADAKLNEHRVAVCRHTHVCVCHTLPDTGTQRSHCSPCRQGGGDGDPPA